MPESTAIKHASSLHLPKIKRASSKEGFILTAAAAQLGYGAAVHVARVTGWEAHLEAANIRPADENAQETELPLQTGIVKWFNESRHYGFITLPVGADIFVHRDNLSGQKISEGDAVEFRIERRGADGKPWAKEVRRIDGQ